MLTLDSKDTGLMQGEEDRVKTQRIQCKVTASSKVLAMDMARESRRKSLPNLQADGMSGI